MDDDYDISYVPSRWPLLTAVLIALMWMSLVFSQPMIWAIGTGAAIALGMGLFTAKFIFGVRNNWHALGLAPLLGVCWLLLFAGIFYLTDF
jgi:hypothetical protein